MLQFVLLKHESFSLVLFLKLSSVGLYLSIGHFTAVCSVVCSAAVVRALASFQYGPGSIPGPDTISGLSLCWFSSLLRGKKQHTADYSWL